eukprot:TRINITY_DN2885_c0_g1_i2.p1 TRINITY_DN2885_c0_g1~~TRINITY_DN2885_c0_g1_i2.p1  ORF type:complete len:417 (+),score=73.39 TRINITY_DN2885_c0_g1_i2:102-1352(+)
MATRHDRYRACMLLGLVGDAVGYRGGRWEFRLATQAIHDELDALTNHRGMAGLVVTKGEWLVSDDSVMHLATAEALISSASSKLEGTCIELAKRYKACGSDMTGRAPGKTTMRMCRVLNADGSNWNAIPFNERGGGCGAAMRAMCIGLRYPHTKDLPQLIAVAVESGRLTHNHPTGYLGAYCAALFTSYAVQNIPPSCWAGLMLQTMPQVEEYVLGCGRQIEQNRKALRQRYFVNKWRKYVVMRGVALSDQQLSTAEIATSNAEDAGDEDDSEEDGVGSAPGALADLAVADVVVAEVEPVPVEPVSQSAVTADHAGDVAASVYPGPVPVPQFPKVYGVKERDAVYREISSRGINPGCSGHDAVLIAYDALLGAGASWEEVQQLQLQLSQKSDDDDIVCSYVVVGCYMVVIMIPRVR